MKITPNQPFRHSKDAYEEGVEVEVPDGLGMYFVTVGWATYDPETVPADLIDHMPDNMAVPEKQPPVTLEVDDVVQNQKSETV